MTLDDEALRGRYRRLIEQHSGSGREALPLETIEALAEDRLTGESRLAALDAVLADPAARQEYEFLREIARARPRSVSPRRPWLAAAAILLLAAGSGLLWRTLSPPADEPLRGGPAPVALGSPLDGGTLAPGDHLTWHPVVGAAGYVVEIVGTDGQVLFRTETTDTTAVYSRPAAGTPAVAGSAQWWVIARLGGAAEQRSAPRRVLLSP